MSKRIYEQSIIKWILGIGATGGTLAGWIFYYLAQIGAITVNGYSGDMICAGTIEDPCYAYINFTANEDIFLYPIGYDAWGRNTTFEFDPNVKEWKLQRSWGAGWRNIPLDKSCTGTWCGLSNSDDKRKFSIAFREDRDYQIRIVAYKYNSYDTIKWSAFVGEIDPYWIGKDKIEWKDNCQVKCTNDKCNKLIGRTFWANDSDNTCKPIEKASSLNNSPMKLIIDNDGYHQVEIIDYNLSTVKLKTKIKDKIQKKNISLKVIKSIDNYTIDNKTGKEIINIKISEKQKINLIYNDGVDEYEQTLNVDFSKGEYIKFGDNSTTIKLQDANTENLDDGYDDYYHATTEYGADDAISIAMIGELIHFSILIKFNNISSIPAEQNIDNSKLYLYKYFNGLDNVTEGYNISNYLVYSNYTINGSDWTEGTGTTFGNTCTENEFCFSTRPTSGYYGNVEDSNYYSGDSGTGWENWDSTNMVQYAVDNSYNNITIMLSPHDAFGTPNYDRQYYYPKEYTIDTTKRPYLNITYTEAAGDSCTYTSGNHTYQGSDNCNISLINAGENTIIINGTGNFRWVRNITNASRIRIQEGCEAIA